MRRLLPILWVSVLILSGCGAESVDAGAGSDAGGSSADRGARDGGTSDPDGGTNGADASSDPDGAVDQDSGSPAADAGPFLLSSLNDEFDGTSLSSAWSQIHPEALNVDVSGGALHLTLNRHALWFNDSQGTLVWKPVSGDFMVTTSVTARKASSPNNPPDRAVHLSGVMARQRGAPGGESYVFIVVGRDEVDLSVEVKTTRNNVSTYEGPSWPSGDAELRLCRVGSTVVLLKRDIGGGGWTEAKRYDRPDFPSELQVGMNPYAIADVGVPDLVVSYDYIRFAPVSGLAACAQ